MNAQHLILIDGYGFVFRAYHSLPPLTRADGVEVGAVYGFTNMLWKVKQHMKATHMAVVFDAGEKNFRHEIYHEYKANRPPAPETLIPQFPLVREAAEAMGLPVFEKKGYEADDVIATLAKEAEREGFSVTIVSSDKDLMQLVSDNIHMYDSMKSQHIDPEAVLKKFDVPPEQVLDYLSMVGDSSDNVPGVPGIGAKTAAALLQSYGSLDNILAHAAELPKPKQRENFVTFADQARLSRDLIRLKEDVDVNGDLSKLVVQETHHDTWLAFLKDQGFKTLIARDKQTQSDEKTPHPSEKKQAPEIRKSTAIELKEITTLEQLKSWCISAEKACKLYIHTLPLSPKEDVLAAIALATDTGLGCWLKTAPPQDGLFQAPGLDEAQVTECLKPLLEVPSVMKVGHNIKGLFHRDSIDHMHPMDDIMILSYDCFAGLHAHDLRTLSETYLDLTLPEESMLFGSGRNHHTLQEAESTSIHEYLTKTIIAITQLYPMLKEQLFDYHTMTVYQRIDLPLIPVLANMENAGITIDTGHLAKLSADFSKKIHTLELEIFSLTGEEFNIGSPKQLGAILFDKMGITPAGKTSKNKDFSTNAETLEELSIQGHTIAEKVLEWRHFSKLKSTYTDALQEQVTQKTKRVHTTFNLHVASTGRLSSTNPNLQNIPVRTEYGTAIRKGFIAKDGYSLISADYSQIELRILAHLADITSLKDAFRDKIDIHTKTASEVFGIPVEDITSDIRRRAKAINFGIIYGISAFGLAKQLSIERSEAAEYIERYFAEYPGIRHFMETSKEAGKAKGYVRTIFGRICHIPDIHHKNPARRQFGERVAINAPIQGSAADIIKKAMIALPEALKKASLDATMLLQVHDELVLEASDGQAQEAADTVKRVMEEIVQLTVPIHAHVGVGKSWADIH